MKSTFLTEDSSKNAKDHPWGKFHGKNDEPFETKMDQIMALGGNPKKTMGVPQSADCRYDFDNMDEDVAADLEGNEFWPYCEENLPQKRAFLCFGRLLKPAETLSFSKTMNGSIFKLPKELTELAEKNFKRMTFMMTEDLTDEQVIDLTKKMLKAALKNTDELKDEMFFQVIKQIRNNTDVESQYKGWKILGCYASFFSPSGDASNPILYYLKHMAQNHPDDEIQVWARYSFVRIVECRMNGMRQVLPSNLELDYIRAHKKIPFTVHFFTGGSMEIFVENYQFLSEIKDHCMEEMGLDKEKKYMYSFFEQSVRPDRIDECYVGDTVNCTDLLASWEHESYFYKQSFGKAAPEIEFKLMLKLGHYVDEPEDSNGYLNVQWNEACYTFKNLHAKVDYESLIKLSAMELQINFGDWDEQRQKFVVEKYHSFVPNYPCKYEMERDEATVVAALGDAYKALSGQKRNDVKKSFVDVVKGFGMMGYIFYVVKVQEKVNCDMDYPERMIIGLKDQGVKMMDMEYNEINNIEYSDIFKWGYSEATLVLLYGDEECPSKIVFRSFQGAGIVHNLTTFVNMKLGKNPKEFLLIQTNMSQTLREKVFFKRVSTYRQAGQVEGMVV